MEKQLSLQERNIFQEFEIVTTNAFIQFLKRNKISYEKQTKIKEYGEQK